MLAFAPLAAAEGSLVIEPQHARFADAYQFTTIRQDYTVRNTGDKPVAIRRIEARSKVGNAVEAPKSLAPGESATIRLELPLTSQLGDNGFRFALFTDEPAVDRYRFSLSGFVQSAFDPASPTIDFGTRRRGDVSGVVTEITTREMSDWKLTGVVDKPDFVTVDVDGHRVTAHLSPTAPPGWINGTVTLQTSSPVHAKVAVELAGFVLGELLPDTRAVNIGSGAIGSTLRNIVVLHGRDRTPIAGKLDIKAPAPWKAKEQPCPSKTPDCAQVEIYGTPTATGPIGGEVFVSLRSGKDPPLPVRFYGIALAPGKRLKTIGDPPDGAATDELATALSQLSTSKTVPTPAEAPPVAPRVEGRAASGAGPAKLHWSASSENSLYGYIVYRSEDRAGPYLRLSRDIIRVQPDTTTTHRYEYIDPTVESGHTYYYYVDSIGVRGQRERFVPVVEKTVR